MMRRSIKQAIAVGMIAGAIALPSLNNSATAATQRDTLWTRYEKTTGTSRTDVVWIKTKCINAEDSAAHLRLVNFGDGRAWYGCKRTGY